MKKTNPPATAAPARSPERRVLEAAAEVSR